MHAYFCISSFFCEEFYRKYLPGRVIFIFLFKEIFLVRLSCNEWICKSTENSSWLENYYNSLLSKKQKLWLSNPFLSRIDGLQIFLLLEKYGWSIIFFSMLFWLNMIFCNLFRCYMYNPSHWSCKFLFFWASVLSFPFTD